MPRKSIKVCVRTRPTSNFAQNELFVDTATNTIAVTSDTGSHEEVMGPNNQLSNFKFSFHHVLHNSAQETVYDSLARDVVQGVADGVNGTIMSYGQTGSGKTFTIIGDTSNFQHRGIAPRALTHIFSEIGMRSETHFSVMCTYMEIYNERIFDLLADINGSEQTREFTIAEEKGGRGVHVRGLTEIPVFSEQEALNLLFSGELGRTTAQHKLNRRSNRSHSIFTVYIAQRSKSGVSEKVIHSKLSIVDLAGSERLKKTMESDENGGPIDETLKKESMHINQSLTYLEQCVVALSRKSGNGSNSTAHIPYRQTKLTNVLKDALGGNCNTLLCACIWGEAAHLEETISTLRLASRMMRVQNDSVQIEVTDPVKLLKKHEQSIKELKQELLMHDALADRTGVVYDPYTPEQEMELRRTLERFLSCGEEEEDEVLLANFRSVRQMRETCRIFKEMYRLQEEHTHRLVTAASAMGTMGLGATEALGANSTMPRDGRWGSTGDVPLVGEETHDSGFSVGMAPDNARPSSSISGGDKGWSTPGGRGGSRSGSRGGGRGGDGSTQNDMDPNAVLQGFEAEPKNGRKASIVGGTKDIFNNTNGGGFMGASPEALADPNMAFVLYKSGAGKEANAEIGRLKVKMKNLKARSKACAASINDFKGKIDDLQYKTDMKRSAKLSASSGRHFGSSGGHIEGLEGSLEDVVDEEEFRLMKKEREAKKMYRAAYEDFASLKTEMENCQSEMDMLKSNMLSNFESWHEKALSNMAANNQTSSSPRDLFGNTLIVSSPEEGADELDDQEAFEKLEISRVVSDDPESLAFFNAQKTRRAKQTQNHVALKQMHKNKRHR